MSDLPCLAPPANALSSVDQSHPRGFWFFFWGEFAERASFYGMRAILPLYLTKVLLLSDPTAGALFFWFKMGCYLLPLLGGFLADRVFGKYWTIVGFSIPYVAGHFILGIPQLLPVSIALVLLAGGSGVIKPNISTLMGQTYDCQRPGQERLRSAAFMWFYFSINVGSFISILCLPWLRDRYGYGIAFQFPAWLMVAALAVFALGKPHYVDEMPRSDSETPGERQEKWAVLGRLFGVFGLMVFFWITYEHNDSLWVFFARDHVNLDVAIGSFVYSVPPDQIQVLNPLCVLLMVPAFNLIFKTLDPTVRFFTATRKIFSGFILVVVAASVMSAAGYLAGATGAKVSIAFPSLAYILLTAGEVLLYGTGLELAYAVAPKNMKGFITACFLLTMTIGNLINVGLSQLYGPLSPGTFFALSAGIALAGAVAFPRVGRQLDHQMAGEAAR